jgi:hypothetical protein
MHACPDCGTPAVIYHHHRGYAPEHWLDVVAMCQSCHGKRHAAAPPKKGTTPRYIALQPISRRLYEAIREDAGEEAALGPWLMDVVVGHLEARLQRPLREPRARRRRPQKYATEEERREANRQRGRERRALERRLLAEHRARQREAFEAERRARPQPPSEGADGR